jgi:hypothetical protein
MITNEQILKIASEHLYCNMSVVEWSGRNEDILNFALQVANIEYDRGFGDGWESRADAERAKDRDTLTVSQPTSTISHEQSINRLDR